MIEIKYVSSNGKEYDLIGDRMRGTSGNFHSYEWKQNSTNTEFGEDVYGFSKEAITYDITLTLRGLLEERKALLDELTDSFEHDIVNTTPGKIYYGEYYIECYIKRADNYISDQKNNWSDCKVEIFCPYPFWSAEERKSFFPDAAGKGEEYDFLDYPYEYSYDYTKPASGSQRWYIDHYRKSNFEMIIYGPCANPRITISNHVYQVFDTLENREYLVIKSRDKTLTKHLSNGTVQNAFAKRNKESSVFELIPNGDNLISWSGEFGFDMLIYKERSVPKWN